MRRLSAGAVALLLVTGLFATLTGPAGADEAVDGKRGEAAGIARQLDSLKQRQMQLAEDFNEANLRLDQANTDIASAQKRVDAIAAQVDEKKSQVRAYALEAYLHGNETPALTVLLTSEGDQASQKKSYLDAAAGNHDDAIDQLRSTRHDLDEEVAKLDKAKGNAQAASDRASRARGENDSAVAEQQALDRRVQGELSELVAEEQQRLAAEQQRANEERAAALAQAEAARQSTTTAAPAPYVAPGTSGAATSAGTGTTNGGGSATAAPRPNAPAAAPGPAPAPKPAPAPAPPPAPKPPASGKAAAAAGIAMGQRGVPYVYGGASPSGFDCSGLVMWAFAQVGINLPHATGAQWAATQPISMSELQVGDLVFFYGMGHNAIYIGGGMVVHAPHTGDVVRTEAVAHMPVTGARRVVG